MARPETPEHKAAFEIWYTNSRNFIRTGEIVGQKRQNLYNWADNYGWFERANARDTAAQRIADTAAAEETAKFLKAQQQAGQLMRLKGIKHLSEHDIEDGRTAIAAIKMGIELERQAMGLPDWIVKILSADLATLDAEEADLERRRREALGDSQGSETAA